MVRRVRPLCAPGRRALLPSSSETVLLPSLSTNSRMASTRGRSCGESLRALCRTPASLPSSGPVFVLLSGLSECPALAASLPLLPTTSGVRLPPPSRVPGCLLPGPTPEPASTVVCVSATAAALRQPSVALSAALASRALVSFSGRPEGGPPLDVWRTLPSDCGPPCSLLSARPPSPARPRVSKPSPPRDIWVPQETLEDPWIVQAIVFQVLLRLCAQRFEGFGKQRVGESLSHGLNV